MSALSFAQPLRLVQARPRNRLIEGGIPTELTASPPIFPMLRPSR
jgi:hypothetical protein